MDKPTVPITEDASITANPKEKVHLESGSEITVLLGRVVCTLCPTPVAGRDLCWPCCLTRQLGGNRPRVVLECVVVQNESSEPWLFVK